MVDTSGEENKDMGEKGKTSWGEKEMGRQGNLG